jgi:hypothetical protein
MDASTLERVVSDFSKSLSSLNGWLVAMTAIVVAGLLIEYIPELPDEWKKFCEAGGWAALRHNRAAWKPLAILAGAVLVTAGVAGEMVFEALSFHKEGQLETAHGNLDTFLQGKAQDAATSAQNAKDAAGIAIQSLIIVGREAGDAQGKASHAKGEADAVGRDVSLAQKQLSKIQEFTRPRFIDIKSITEATKPYPGTAFMVRWFPDADSDLLSGEIVNALGPTGAGWKPTVWQYISIADAKFTEVYVDHIDGLTAAPNPEPGCQALVKAMVANFVGPTMSNGTRHPKDPNVVVITIGTRGLEWVPPSEKDKKQILNSKPASAPPGMKISDPCAPNP